MTMASRPSILSQSPSRKTLDAGIARRAGSGVRLESSLQQTSRPCSHYGLFPQVIKMPTAVRSPELSSLLSLRVVTIMASIIFNQDSAEKLHICKEIFGSRHGKFTLILERWQGHQ